ncbi:MAG: pentapeptide repeat-containing protein [Streptosporangiaceae bacterium]
MPRDRLADLPYADTLKPHQGDLAADGDYEGAHFDGLDLDAPRAPGSRFMECAFTQVTMQDGQLRRTRFNDVWMRGVRLTATELTDSNWIHATIIGSVAAGVIAHGSRLRQVTFRGCKLHGVNFRAATLTEVTFEDCTLREVDFGGATLRRCQFPGSQLHDTDFSQVTLDKVDLRGAELGIIITPGSLKGATISSAQLAELAPLLAEQAGITVE